MSIDDEQKGENDNDEEFDLPAMDDDAGGDDLVSHSHPSHCVVWDLNDNINCTNLILSSFLKTVPSN
jgi:hypothetical protein